MKKQFFIFAIIFTVLASCGKQTAEVPPPDDVLIAKAAEEVNYVYPPDDGEEGAKYIEYACKTEDNRAGTLCSSGKGKCKKEKTCKAVTTVATLELSAVQINSIAEEHAARMVQEGYIDAKDTESSKRLAKEFLTRLQKR